MEKYYFGWQRDIPDQRDQIFSVTKDVKLAPSVDLRPMLPAVYDQGDLNSCTANAVAGVIEHDLIAQKKICPNTPSRLYIYYNTRYLSGVVEYDSGASIRQTIKSLNVYGFCDERIWPYNPAKFNVKPLKEVYTEALRKLVVNYQRVPQTIADLKAMLSLGFPVVFGFSVYQSFISNAVAMTGIVPMPGTSEYLIGGHAMTIVGYDDAKQWFICRNSWGSTVGDRGFYYMPYAYLSNPNLSSDFWTIKSVA